MAALAKQNTNRLAMADHSPSADRRRRGTATRRKRDQIDALTTEDGGARKRSVQSQLDHLRAQGVKIGDRPDRQDDPAFEAWMQQQTRLKAKRQLIRQIPDLFDALYDQNLRALREQTSPGGFAGSTLAPPEDEL